MTSNERKIIRCLWDAKGTMHIQIIAQKTGISSDYARLLCRSLERGGYLKFADVNICCLLTKGRNCFQDKEEIIDSDEKSEDENKQDEDLDQVLTELDQFVKEETKPADEEDAEEDIVEDIIIEETKPEESQDKIAKGEDQEGKENTLDNLQGISDNEKEKLSEAGYKTVEDLAEAPVSKLIQSIGVNLKKAADWINQARRQTGAIDDKNKKVESKK